MAAKSSLEDVVLVYGPPYSGKSLYYRENMKHSYHRICPAEIYRENPDYGLRDVCLRLYGYIKKSKKVVIEDDSENPVTRQAYFTAIKKKFPKCHMKLTEIRPKYGELQCLWAQQYVMANSAADGEEIQDKHAEIQKWFLTESPSSPTKEQNDEVAVEHKILPLTAVVNYKLEVPALFLQWEALNTDMKNTTPVGQMCQNWCDVNTCGRVIVICDGKNVSKGLLSQQEEDFAVKNFIQVVMKKVRIPIYVIQVLDLCKAGGFCIPPEPGILAFLQKRHHLDLHCRATQYVYTSSTHKAMAERAGVRHIKIPQVLHRPNLLISGHSSATPRIPDLLKHLVVVKDTDERGPEIPLYGHTDNMTDGHIQICLPGGKRETMFANDNQVIHNYQNDYARYATSVRDEGSRIQDLHHTGHDKSHPSSKSPPSLPDIPTLSSDSSTGSTNASVRGLPSWMLGKSKQSSSSNLSKSDSTSSTEERTRAKTTVYMMSEQELMDTAKQILKQGGREDLIAVLERQEKEKEEELAMNSETPLKQKLKQKHTQHKSRAVPEAMEDEPEGFRLDDMLAVPTLSMEGSPRKRRSRADDQSCPHRGHTSVEASQASPAKMRVPESVPVDSNVGQDRMAGDLNVDEVRTSDCEDECVDDLDITSRRQHISAVLDALFD